MRMKEIERRWQIRSAFACLLTRLQIDDDPSMLCRHDRVQSTDTDLETLWYANRVGCLTIQGGSKK